MRKSTKKLLMALAIILIFGLSTIAFVATGLFGTPQQSQLQPLEGYVIDRPIDPQLEAVYVQNQFTFLRFYYREKDALYNYVAQLPDLMPHPGGYVQLIVNRLEAGEPRAEIVNLGGSTDVADLTEEGIFSALCGALIYTPTDCLLLNITAPQQNATTAANISG